MRTVAPDQSPGKAGGVNPNSRHQMLDQAREEIEHWRRLAQPFSPFLRVFANDRPEALALHLGFYDQPVQADASSPSDTAVGAQLRFVARGQVDGPGGRRLIEDLQRVVELRFGPELGRTTLVRYEQALSAETAPDEQWQWEVVAEGPIRFAATAPAGGTAGPALPLEALPRADDNLIWLARHARRAGLLAGVADYEIQVLDTPTPAWSRALRAVGDPDGGVAPLWFDIRAVAALDALAAWVAALETVPGLWVRALTVDAPPAPEAACRFHAVLQTFGRR
ncbi:MAG: hypothetical protein K9N49_06905 [Candidatus Marinimicrobia bacterium]|nr:hypothetical protein [Candidatus Neomarinimicrobiota bacterium]